MAKHIGLRYMTRFACTGAECEDNCCTGWQVPVDEQHYAALRVALERSPDERAEFQRSLKLSDRPTVHALMVLRPDQTCSFLDGERLCSLQRRFGEPLLPDTCAIYPRSIGKVGERWELAGAVSCPEVARLALLADDATDLIDIDPALVGRPHTQKILTGDETPPYARHFDDVRATAFQLLARTSYPIASRLFFVAYFAHQTASFFHRNVGVLDEQRLAAQIDLIERPSTRAELHKQFSAVPPNGPFALTVILEVLRARYGTACPPAFRKVVDEVLGGYAVDGAVSTSGDAVKIDRPLLWAAFERRRAERTAMFGERLELYAENFCKNSWIKDWYLKSPSLAAHTQGMLVRLAIVRFLLLGHPAAAAAASPADLDRLAVRVFYTFSRAIEHETGFARDIERVLEEQKMQTLAHSVALLKV